MSEVKRYKMSVVTSATYPKVRSDEDEAGSWVMYDDYDALEARLQKMREALVRACYNLDAEGLDEVSNECRTALVDSPLQPKDGEHGAV